MTKEERNKKLKKDENYYSIIGVDNLDKLSLEEYLKAQNLKLKDKLARNANDNVNIYIPKLEELLLINPGLTQNGRFDKDKARALVSFEYDKLFNYLSELYNRSITILQRGQNTSISLNSLLDSGLNRKTQLPKGYSSIKESQKEMVKNFEIAKQFSQEVFDGTFLKDLGIPVPSNWKSNQTY